MRMQQTLPKRIPKTAYNSIQYQQSKTQKRNKITFLALSKEPKKYIKN